MEEQEAPAVIPPGNPELPQKRRKVFSPEARQAMLDAYASWQGNAESFCQQHGIHTVTLYKWRRTAKSRPGNRLRRFTPEQKRQAVETLEKSGQSVDIFGKAWGVNPRVLSRWRKAYLERGPKALEGRGGRRPGRRSVASGMREEIVAVKRQFPDFGLRKVQGFLARFKGLQPSQPQIRRVVDEERLPHGRTAEKRWKKRPIIRRFERSRPGELWQSDITSFVLPRYGQRVFLVAFMDDYSRYIVAWKLGLKQTTDFVLEALLEGIQRFGKPQELLTDQGRQYYAWRGTSEFQRLLDQQGIRHVISRAHHPETLGKCERFWKTVGEEFWSRAKPLEFAEAQSRLGAFINHYNHFRPHQGLDNAVPADRFFAAEPQVRQALEKAWKTTNWPWPLTSPHANRCFLWANSADRL